MKKTFPNKQLEKEDEMLRRAYFDTDTECKSILEFVDKNASEEFKKYLKKSKERKKRLWEEKGEIEE